MSKKATFMLIMALCAVPCSINAMTTTGNRERAGVVDQDVHAGTIQAIMPGASIKIDDVVYIFSPSTTLFHDETGKVVAYLSFKPGMLVKFLLKPEGAKKRITALWVIKK